MFEKLEKVCGELGYKILVHERSENLWHVSVQGEHGTVAHARGKSQDDAAAKVFELLRGGKAIPYERKAVARRRTKPAKIVATKVVESEADGDE